MPYERYRHRIGVGIAGAGAFNQYTSGNSFSNKHELEPDLAFNSEPIRIPKDYPTLQAAFDAEVVNAGWGLIRVATGLLSSSAGSENISGAGTAFLSQVQDNDFILMAGEYYCVRDISTDTALRLWHGAKLTSSGVAATIYRPTPICLITDLAENTLTGDPPDGIDLQIMATKVAHKWLSTNSATLRPNRRMHLTIHNITAVNDHNGLIFVQVFGQNRGKLHVRNMAFENNNPGVAGFGFTENSAVIFQNIWARNQWKTAHFSDYALIENIGSQNSVEDDVHLQSIASDYSATDIAYDYEISNFVIKGGDDGSGGFNGGFEVNLFNAAKSVNISYMYLERDGVSVVGPIPSHPFWAPSVGTVNFTDCILETNSAVEEIYNRGATINFTRTYRKDGVSLPRLSP